MEGMGARLCGVGDVNVLVAYRGGLAPGVLLGGGTNLRMVALVSASERGL